MSALVWRPLDDISVDFDAEESLDDDRVIEFSTWCEGEYCEPVRVTPRRARELLSDLARSLHQSRSGVGEAAAIEREHGASPVHRLIRIEVPFIDSYLVRVDIPEACQAELAGNAHAGGYTMRHGTREEALHCAIRECSQWLAWSLDGHAYGLGVRFADELKGFLRAAQRLHES